MPSQKQLRWAELRVGVTVIFAAIVLMFLIFLMGGATGFFSHTIRLYTYVQDASGLRNGAPVRLQNVDIGNVQSIRIVNHHSPTGVSTPVQITMKVNSKSAQFVHTDSVVMLTTAGVLGETYLDIDSTHAKGPVVSDNTELPAQDVPDMQDVIKTSQGAIQSVDVLVKRLDRIVTAVEDQKGSVGQLIYDRRLYENLNHSIQQVNGMLTDINNGRGSIGKLLNDDTLYTRATTTIDKVNTIADNINNGHGTIAKLIQDPALYDNANQTLAKANELVDSINRGEGGIGLMAKDKDFAKKLNLLVTNLSQISQELNAGNGSAGRLLKDPSVYNNLDSLLVESRGLMAAIRRDPKRYLSIKLHIF